jgi:predicted MPP superfamily phosphohydrolase
MLYMPHEQRVAMILGLALLAFFALARYVFAHVSRVFALPRGYRWPFYGLVFVAIASAILPRFFAPQVGGLAPFLGTFAAVVVLGLLLSAILLLPYELARLLFLVGKRVRRGKASGAQAPAQSEVGSPRSTGAPSDPARRAFVQQAAVGGAVSVGLGATLYGTLLGRHDYQLETVPIKLARLPRTLDGFRIVQLSDLHVGTFVSDYEFRRGLELVRRAKPDLIVLTGDLIDHDLRYLPALGRFARALATEAPLYGVVGNHDHYTGVERVERTVTQAGGHMLVNRHVRIGQGKDSFVLAGLDDVFGNGVRGPHLTQTFADAPPDLARVLLSHNPGYYPTSHAFADLTLSGHTHGGQITLFINPAKIVLRHGLVRGHYYRAESQLYVNRGFGTAGPPTRVGSPPEITSLVLTSA